MSLSRFTLKNFGLFISRYCQQSKLHKWTEKLYQCYFQKSELSFTKFKPLSNTVNIPYYFNLNCQKLAKYKFKFYRQWYDDSTTKKLIAVLFKRFHPSRPLYTFAAAAYSFSWENNGISNAEIQSFIDELLLLHQQSLTNKDELPQVSEFKNLPYLWEKIVDEPYLKIWKLPYKKSGIFQYKVYGRFTDISAKQFFTIQKNVEYRRVWDDLVIDIKIIDENKKTNEQVIQWISHFPYPFNPREYVYIRKTKVDKDNNLFVIMSRSVEHPGCVTSKNHIRVPFYVSDMVIKPHKGVDDPGLDYLLTYCDNPRTHLPTRLCNWIASVGIPDFINKLHKAALLVDNYSERNNSNDMQPLNYTQTPIGAF